MIDPGRPSPLGATLDANGVNFAIWSGAAKRVELCLFDERGVEVRRCELPERTARIWHGYLPGCKAGQHYGYRVHGRYAPEDGLRFNPNKLLIDPYARALAGQFRWAAAVYDYVQDAGDMRLNDSDSAPCIPKSVVVADDNDQPRTRPVIPWSETIIYEANVRGYTMRHPDVPQSDRGTFRGMKNGRILEYLKALGITSIELLPVHEFIDEATLVKRGLRNFWGYNSINFFVPAGRYANGSARREFRAMTDAIHEAGFEVLLDVAYNHTGETDRYGPTLSFRGIDNLGYYRTQPDDPGRYVNDTGCGNTINADHRRVRELIVDSLRYWVRDMGVDGFRFDLATVTARADRDFSRDHPLFQAIDTDADLQGVKFIAEPWDVGPDGYQLGNFPPRWAEWNDRYRDSVRRFWRGDSGETAEFARRVHGSADLFEASGRRPAASINYVSAHDGFTLADVVSYERRHNGPNGEDNDDGHAHNFSCNYGVEGSTGDAEILATRRRQRLNMLATLMLSQGTPMLLAGDEFGNSQHGNNNAYAQDNETGWLDWRGLDSDPEFRRQVGELIRLRKDTALIRQDRYLHDSDAIAWWHPDGRAKKADDWAESEAFGLMLRATDGSRKGAANAVLMLMNPSHKAVEFVLPSADRKITWQVAFTTDDTNRSAFAKTPKKVDIAPQSLAVCFLLSRETL